MTQVLPVEKDGDALLVQIDARPHLDTTLTLSERGLLVLVQLFPEMDWGKVPEIFAAKSANCSLEEFSAAFGGLYAKGMVGGSK